jgi:hypothetical protein
MHFTTLKIVAAVVQAILALGSATTLAAGRSTAETRNNALPRSAATELTPVTNMNQPASSLHMVAQESPKQKQPPLAGWLGIFPPLAGYARTFKAPVVEGDKNNPVYRQEVEYAWTGGADRHLTISVARDAKFKKAYGEEEVKKSLPAPEKIEVGKHAAWLWKFESDKKVARPLRARLVVLLGDDRILIVEVRGLGPFAGEPQTTVGKFDLERLTKALDDPPLTGSRRMVEAFRQLKKGMSYSEVSTWVGLADKDIGSGIHIMVYALDDGTSVLLGFADFNQLLYVKHRDKEGTTVDLVSRSFSLVLRNVSVFHAETNANSTFNRNLDIKGRLNAIAPHHDGDPTITAPRKRVLQIVRISLGNSPHPQAIDVLNLVADAQVSILCRGAGDDFRHDRMIKS